MKSVFVFGLFLASVSAYIAGVSTLYPGYVINYNTPKSQVDSHYGYIPITGIDSSSNISIALGLSIDSELNPVEALYWSEQSLPVFTTPILSTTKSDTKIIPNVENGLYWIGAKSDCSGTVPQCKDSVDAEVSLWTYNASSVVGSGGMHWPPYMLIDQRRTAKFQILSGQGVYFWLTVTNDVLSANGVFNLYMGVQFFNEGSSSSVQMSVWNPSPQYPWPTAPIYNSTDGLEDYWPRDPTQQNDWVQSTPTSLSTGIYKVGAVNTKSSLAEFTVKVGFNKAPVQAANMNASFHPMALLTLISLCIIKHLLF